jgi:hypothetical protein
MDSALARDGRRLEKQIHQHGLAAPDRPPNVEAAKEPAIASRAQEPAKRRRSPRALSVGEREPQSLELAKDEILTLVTLDVASAHLFGVTIEKRARHQTLVEKRCAQRTAGSRGSRIKETRSRDRVSLIRPRAQIHPFVSLEHSPKKLTDFFDQDML